MNCKLRAAAQQALEALIEARSLLHDGRKQDKAATALRAALAEQESVQPVLVAYVCPTSHVTADGSMEDGPDYLEWADEASDYEKRVGTPLYTASQPAKPVESVQAHAEELAKLGWQYSECPACGSECARAFPQPAKQPLTDEEIDAIFTQVASTQEVYDMAAIRQSIARAIEAAHGITGETK